MNEKTRIETVFSPLTLTEEQCLAIKQLREKKAMDDEPTCQACNTAWIDHLGPTGTCHQLQKARAEIDHMKNVIKEAVLSSIPYMIKHQAFLISGDSFNAMSRIAFPENEAVYDLLDRAARGEQLTKKEIENAFGETI